jgi:DNA-directed RNA polymerase specialized sigma24 family protein
MRPDLFGEKDSAASKSEWMRSMGLQTMNGEPRHEMEPALHTSKDFEQAVAALSGPDKNRLSAVARAMQGSTGMTWEDLYQEAYVSGLSLDRKWRDGIDVVKFLAEAMSSIADRRRKSVGLAKRVSAMSVGEGGPSDTQGFTTAKGVLFEVRAATPSAEDILIANEDQKAELARLRARRDQLLDLFEDDEDAQGMVLGMLDGQKGAKLMETTGLGSKEFASKYKKVARRIDALHRRQP